MIAVLLKPALSLICLSLFARLLGCILRSKMRCVVAPSRETATPLNPHLTKESQGGISKSRDRPWFWAIGKCRSLSPRPLRGESFAEPLANPLLSKWLCVQKDAWFVTASHLPAPQCQSIRQGRQPWEIQSFLSALSFARGMF
jgi:hypothetical protein